MSTSLCQILFGQKKIRLSLIVNIDDKSKFYPIPFVNKDQVIRDLDCSKNSTSKIVFYKMILRSTLTND
jgi:hypothetical protein